MADLMVTMGIDDRGVRQGVRRAEDIVHRSQAKMNSAFDSNALVSQKAVGKIASELTGMSLKYGALGGAFLAFRSGTEYLREFESALPKAERGLERLTDVSKKFKETWAIGAEMLVGGIAGNLNGGGLANDYNSLINAVGDLLKPKARSESAPLFGKGSPLEFLNGNDSAPLSEGTSAEADAAYRDDLKRIAAGRLKEQSLATQKALEAEILGLQGRQYEADLARLEAARLIEYIKIKEKADSGMSPAEVMAEKDAAKAREKAGREKAGRDRQEREDADFEKRRTENERTAREAGRAWVDEQNAKEMANEYRIRAGERTATTLDERIKVAEQRSAFERSQLEMRARLNALDRGVSDDVLADQLRAIAEYSAADLEATKRDIMKRKDPDGPDGLDLSSAGAFASQGQAMAFQIPGKIDRTNVLLQQSGQTLQRIEQKLDGTARFSP